VAQCLCVILPNFFEKVFAERLSCAGSWSWILWAINFSLCAGNRRKPV